VKPVQYNAIAEEIADYFIEGRRQGVQLVLEIHWKVGETIVLEEQRTGGKLNLRTLHGLLRREGVTGFSYETLARDRRLVMHYKTQAKLMEEGKSYRNICNHLLSAGGATQRRTCKHWNNGCDCEGVIG